MKYTTAAFSALALVQSAIPVAGCPFLSMQRGSNATMSMEQVRDWFRAFTAQNEHPPVRGLRRNDCRSLPQGKGQFCYGRIFPGLEPYIVDWSSYVWTGHPKGQENTDIGWMNEDDAGFGPNYRLGPRTQQIADGADGGFPTKDDFEQQLGDGGPAGYTYLGQLLSHDVNKDKNTLLGTLEEPLFIQNDVAARLDLDTIYGPVPGQGLNTIRQFVFQLEGPNNRDFKRDKDGKALIPDERNDNNVVLLQITVAFMMLHNKLFDYFSASMNPKKAFDAARLETERNWQSIALYDLLPHFVSSEVFDELITNRAPPVFYKEGQQAYDEERTPIEFSTCAYRTFHSRLANNYFLGGPIGNVLVFDPVPGVLSLEGGIPLDEAFAVFPFDVLFGFPGRGPRASGHFLDPLYSDSLHFMPLGVPGNPSTAHEILCDDGDFCTDRCGHNGKETCRVVDDIRCEDCDRDELFASLAIADLVRGQVHGLPGGIAMATAAQQVDDDIKVYPMDALRSSPYGLPDAFEEEDDVPCLLYLFHESYAEEESKVLGRFGSRIVAETILGFVRHTPGNMWDDPWTSVVTGTTQVTFADILDYIDWFSEP